MDLRRWSFIILFMSILHLLQLCLNLDYHIIKNTGILDTFLEHLTHLKIYTFFDVDISAANIRFFSIFNFNI